MAGPEAEEQPAYHLFLDAAEVPVAASALRLLISDEAHEPGIRALARQVLEQLAAAPPAGELLTVELTPPQMKLTFSAVKLLINDLSREQADERQVLWGILGKLPDEHTIRAIQLD
jgi:hypothetical protein